MDPLSAGRQGAVGATKRRCLLLLALLAATAGQVVAAKLSPDEGADAHLFPTRLWHYGIVSEDGSSTELVWQALPDSDSPVTYAIQRWPTATLPLPGQDGYLNSLVQLDATNEETDGTFTAVDSSPVAEADSASRPFYRILALASSGRVLAASQPAQAAISKGNVFVSTRSCGGGPCRKLLQQKTTIQAAIDAAAPGATVNVLPGTYTGDENTNLVFDAKAVTLLATAGPDATIIDCQSKARAFVFTAKDTRRVQIKGFTMKNGAADTGGCIAINDGSPTISNCVFQSCKASSGVGFGGGFYAYGEQAHPLVQDCAFRGCFATVGAGGYVHLANLTLERSSFDRGETMAGAGRGAGIFLLNNGRVDIRQSSFSNGKSGMNGGGLSIAESLNVHLDRIRVFNNKADAFGCAFEAFASKVYVTNSEIFNNTAMLFGGGGQAQYSLLDATNVTWADNTAAYGGGGALNIVTAAILIRNSFLKGNRATYGGALSTIRLPQPSGEPVPTIVSVNDSTIDSNIVTSHGGAFYFESADLGSFLNVNITNNAAGARGGGGACSTTTPLQMYFTRSENNAAPNGGGLYAGGACQVLILGAEFKQNTASEYGAGIAATDGTSLDISLTRFIQNGVSGCASQQPPVGGGGIFVGLQNFQPDATCGYVDNTTYAQLKLNSVTFVGNIASDRGGAVHVVAGGLAMDTVSLVQNKALGSGDYDGVGGGIALDERCTESQCSPVVAQLSKLNVTRNTARMAGAGIYYNGTSTGGGLSLRESAFMDNAVDAAMQGVGAGLYIGRGNFSVAASNFAHNKAFFGGGLFVSADLRRAATLSSLNFTDNSAIMGSAAFWLHDKSTAAPLKCDTCTVNPKSKGAIATEALSLGFGGSRPTFVQANKDFPRFEVQLRDFYGNVMRAERGMCKVSDAPNSSQPAVLSARGREEYALDGIAEFTRLQMKGVINQSYSLQIEFDRLAELNSKFLLARSLPSLNLSVTIASCAPGSQLNANGSDCVECSAGTYNLDGSSCLPCPEGADCLGGSAIVSKADYWRSSSASVHFYSCKREDICEAGPAAGDEACADGHRGPLCNVCEPDHFKFDGECRKCKGSATAKTMIALTIILLVVLVLALFGRDWHFGHGPGIVSKIKIFLSHFQTLSMFNHYDVVFPSTTSKSLGWFDIINISLSMFAPECYFGDGYSFYALYIFQMLLPLLLVSACVALYYGADFWLQRLDPTGSQRQMGSDAKGLVAWLQGLKVRCWRYAFWFVTLLYPHTMLRALQLFGHQKLDTGTYLRVDFSILVKRPGGNLRGPYLGYMIPGIFVIIVLAIGIPFFWFYTVFRHRDRLDDPDVHAKYGFLYSSYSAQYPYWETLELVRKFAFAFIPVFIPAKVDGSYQAAAAQIVLLFCITLAVKLWPFALTVDNWLQLTSLVVLWILIASSDVSKWADISDSGNRALSGLQILLSSGVGFILLCAILFGLAAIFVRLSQKLRGSKVAEIADRLAKWASAGSHEQHELSLQRFSRSSSKRSSMAHTSSKRISLFDSGLEISGAADVDDNSAAAKGDAASGSKPAAGTKPHTIHVLAAAPADDADQAGPSSSSRPPAGMMADMEDVSLGLEAQQQAKPAGSGSAGQAQEIQPQQQQKPKGRWWPASHSGPRSQMP